MAQKQMVKHGTRAGYDAELAAGGPENVCDRCRKAKRVYAKQFTRQGKAQGLHYTSHDVIDHLYNDSPQTRPQQARTRGSSQAPASRPSEVDSGYPNTSDADTATAGSPGLRERLSDALFSLKAERQSDTGYVPIDEQPEYIHPIDPDPEPSGEDWSHVKPDEFVITADNIKAIKDNLGMYLVTAGMTIQLIDPYCGSILRDNLDDMVDSWSRVIMHYPSAAKLFMAKGGGKIMAWLDALMATWPILLAIYEHHLAHTVKIDSLGRAIRVSKADATPNGHFATEPQFDYTVE